MDTELDRDTKITAKGEFGFIGMTEALLGAGFEVGDVPILGLRAKESQPIPHSSQRAQGSDQLLFLIQCPYCGFMIVNYGFFLR